MSYAAKAFSYPWNLYLTGGATVLLGNFLFDTYRSSRNRAPFFSPTAVQLVEEHARYPCTVLKGMDVVVRNHYVRKSVPPAVEKPHLCSSPHPTNPASVRSGEINVPDKENVGLLSSCSAFFSEMRHRLHRFALLFSNETHRVPPPLEFQRSATQEGGQPTESSSLVCREEINSNYCSGNGNLLHTCTIVHEAPSTNLGASQREEPDAKRNEVVHHFGVESHKLSSGDTPSKEELVASAGWPPYTQKYASLSLEPSKSIPGSRSKDSNGDAVDDINAASVALRCFADTTTHQSLVRCSPFSNIPGTNCEADPAYLGADYLHIMLGAFLLLPSALAPMRVGVLGVGGGSLPLFLLRYFSRNIQHLDLVDVEPMCIRAAVQDLGFGDALKRYDLALCFSEVPEGSLHADSTTTQVHLEDAKLFLRKHQSQMTGQSPPLPDRPMNGRTAVTVRTPPALASFSLWPTGKRSSDTEPRACGLSSSSFASSTPQVVEKSKLSTTPLQSSFLTSSQRTQERAFDLLFVDLFQGSNLAEGVNSAEFLALCRASLSSYGVAAFNLPARDRPFVDQCQRIFGDKNTYLIPSPSSANVVVLVRGGSVSAFARRASDNRTIDGAIPAPRLSHRVLYRRAAELSKRHRLPFDLSTYYPVWWYFW